jgi:hypothetical protein
MSDPIEFLRKEEILAVVRRAGVPGETLDALEAALPDPVSVCYGINLDSIISAMGGSP